MPSAKTQSTAKSGFPKKTPAVDAGKRPLALIDARIAELQDWRGELLCRLRRLLRGTSNEVVEEWKWNVPVWSCNGIICTGETYKKVVKLTFPRGASLADPSQLFNSSLEGNARRAIDFPEGSHVNESAFTELIKAAIALNKASVATEAKSAAKPLVAATSNSAAPRGRRRRERWGS